MDATTMIRRRAEMTRRPLPECHRGRGALDWTEILGNTTQAGRRLAFLHDDILPPGASIGVHRHADDEEYYYILEGRGTMTLDGERYPVEAGDVTAIFPGGRHGLENDSEADLRVLVIGLAPERKAKED